MALTHAKRVHLRATLSPIDIRRAAPDGRRLSDPGTPVVELVAQMRAVGAADADIRQVRSTVGDSREWAVLDAVVASETEALGDALAALGQESEDVARKLTVALAEARLSRLVDVEKKVERQVLQAEDEWLTSIASTTVHELVARDAEEDRAIARVDRAMRYATPAEGARLGELTRDGSTGAVPELVNTIEARLELPEIPDAVPDEAETAILNDRLRSGLQKRSRFTDKVLTDRVAFVLSSAVVPASIKLSLQESAQALGTSQLAFTALKENLGAIIRDKGRPSMTSPIGYLHLERLNYSPDGIEHGELVYSLPLAPGEEVALVHKEWANTSEEFTKLVADQFEDYSERGVVDKVDMAEATTAQRSHSTSFNVAVAASGGFGPVSLSASTSFSAQSASSASRSTSINESQTITKKASARTRKEHRTSFKLAKKTHVEDQTVRRIKNPDPFHAVRFDFFQLLRRWRVDLFRYDVRLTYDLTIPEPAIDLLAVYAELRRLEDELEKGFDLHLPPGSVNRFNWREMAERYGAAIEAPPPLVRSVQALKVLGPYADDDPDDDHHDELRVATPEGYRYLERKTGSHYYYRNTEDLFPGITVYKTISKHPEVTEEIAFGVYTDSVRNGFAMVRVWFELLPELEDKWELAASNAVREAANKAYLEHRQIIEQRRARILAELSDTDALTLRKLEREELMKGVLRWLFGPGFDFAPPVAGSYFDPEGAVSSKAVQNTVLSHGKVVSFLHQAIEWENINYFMYPYFWTTKASWDLRLRLRHSDPIHEAFLRSGAARVVLPIRREWERAFLTFLATASLSATLPDTHPYMTIAEEIENFAQTNYPGIVPANPDQIDPDAATQAAEGIEIASWYEYTPTSALDIKVGETAPAEGDFLEPSFTPDALWTEIAPLRDGVVSVLTALAKKLTPPS